MGPYYLLVVKFDPKAQGLFIVRQYIFAYASELKKAIAVEQGMNSLQRSGHIIVSGRLYA